MRPHLHKKLLAVQGSSLSGLRNLPLPSKVSLGFILLLALLAVFAPLVAPFDPLLTGKPAQPPGSEHLFGTDAIGRDVFSRVLFGARSSLLIGLCATASALVAAAVLGSIAATARRAISEVLMRILDIIMSFPGIALAAVFVAVFGNSLPVLIFTIGFLYVPQLSRVVRANVLSQFGEDYVAASKVMGASTTWILMKHVARNCAAPIMVFATVLVADAIVFEASLSFINAGVKPPDPSWGNVLSDGKQLLLSGAWWPTFFPGLMILLTVLSLNILSEGLTDTLASPKVRKGVDVDADEQALHGDSKDAVSQTAEAFDGAVATPGQGFEPHLQRQNDHASDPGDLAESADVEEAGQRSSALPGGKVLGTTDTKLANELLATSLTRLHVSETSRDDRLVYSGDSPPLLEVKNLRIAFPEAHGDVDIVDDVSFAVRESETMGLVGESGCGKSITAMAIMGLLPSTARISGEVRFDGTDVLQLNPKDRNALRGHDMAMIYQDALSSLNPSMLIRAQLKQLTSRGGKRSAEDLLDLVGLDPKRMLSSYPHELSGGQRQRVLIAMALTRNPRLVIADEPTTALDVTVQKQVVDLLNDLREQLGFAMVFVSHDLALVAELAHRITVMYAGQVVEQGATRELLVDPRHEYTRGLLGSVLSIESGAERLHQVPGTVPSPREFLSGNRFAPRSSNPTFGVDIRPTMHRIPDTTHSVAVIEEEKR